MATIKTALSLYDGVTGPIRSMAKATSNLISIFENMQSVTSNPINVERLQEARMEMEKMDEQMNTIEASISKAHSKQEQFTDSIRESSTAAGGLWDKLKGVAATVGGITAIEKLVDLSDNLAGTNARLSLIVDDGGSVADLEKKIMASAKRSRAAYTDTAAAVSKLGLMAADAFGNNDELIQFTELINKQFTIAGTSATEASNAMLQLTQAMASGVLRGDELNSIFEQAPTIIQSIADYLDVPIGKIREMASEGEITADIVKNSMFAAADDINSKFSTMPMTWGQVFTQAGNIALQALQPLLNGINWLANNISIVGPAVLGLAGAFVVFQIAAHWTQIAAAATAIYHGVVTFLSIGFGILTGNTAAASAAVFTFNSALLANPIVWVVMLIMVLIGVLYAAVAAVNKFKGTSISATGIIGAAFAVLGAHVINTFVVPLQNAFAMIANFFGNVFNDPVAAVKVLFYDMCLTVIGYITNLAHAIENLINKIPGVQVNITSGLDSFYKGLEEAQQKVKDESGWVEYVQKMDYIDYSSAGAAGYEFGEGVADKISSIFGGDTSLEDYNAGTTWDGIYDNTADTASNTAASADALDYAEEELEYLRDIAEREAINRFTTAEIKIDMGGVTNNLASDMDIDGVVDALGNYLGEQIAVSAEGVHS